MPALMKQLVELPAIPLSNQKTVAKCLVIAIRLGYQKTIAKSLVMSLSKWPETRTVAGSGHSTF
jgi:hypothetical protein